MKKRQYAAGANNRKGRFGRMKKDGQGMAQ